MSDASPLLVPITCEALVVNDLVRTGERWLRLTMAYADLTNPPGTATPRDPSQADPLFTAQPGTDVAPGITSSQFYNGVYLKWRLPPALLRGAVDNRTGETRFPPMPNRWLVVRLGGVDPANRTAAAWIIESDFVNPQGFAATTSSGRSAPYVVGGDADPTSIAIGRNVALGAWTEPGTSLRLTAMAPGNPAFAWSQPSCNNVLSFIDPLGAGAAPDQPLSYLVVGWYSDPADDPLAGAKDFDRRLHDLGWRRAAGGDPTATASWSLLVGVATTVGWTSGAVDGGAPEGPVAIAVGRSSAEALTALIAGQAGGDRHVDPELLEAFQLGAFDLFDRPDGAALLAEQVERHGFARVTGGYHWELVDAPSLLPEAGRAATGDAIGDATGDAVLATLNQAQAALDAAVLTLHALERQLYVLWWKLQNFPWVSSPPPPPAIDGLGDDQRLRAELDPRRPGSVAAAVVAQLDLVAQLAAAVPTGATPLELADAIAAYAAAHGVPAGRELRRSAAGAFLRPADPVVLLAGAGAGGLVAPPPQQDVRFPDQVITGFVFAGQDVSAATAGLTIPQADLSGVGGAPWTTDLVAALTTELFFLDPTSATAIAAALGSSDVAAIAAALGAPDTTYLGGVFPRGGVTAWNGNPWRPLQLLWSASYAPLAYATAAGPAWEFVDGAYRWTGDPDSIGAPLALSGLVQLTPAAAVNLRERLRTFVRQRPDLPPDQRRDLEALIRTIDDDDGWELLSQALDGWNPQLQLGQPGAYQAPTGELARLIGAAAAYPPTLGDIPTVVAPDPPTGFQPWRAGQFELTSLAVIDEWGQTLWPINSSTATTTSLFVPPELMAVQRTAPALLPVVATVTLAAIAPAAVTVGGGDLVVTATGAGFDRSATLRWDGGALATTFVDGSTATAVVPARLLTAATTATLTLEVTAGTSAPLSFAVVAGPVIAAVAPPRFELGAVTGDAVTLTVLGSGFGADAVVRWGERALATQVVSAGELTARVPARLLARPAAAAITVATGGLTSAAAALPVAAGAAITGLSPPAAVAGSGALTLTVTGVGFASDSTVMVGGVASTTTFVDETALTVAVTAAQLAAVGPASVVVTTGTAVDPTTAATLVQLPPAALQPARLDVRLLANDDDGASDAAGPRVVRGLHPSADPILGWVLPDHLGHGLALYDGGGHALGALAVGQPVTGPATVCFTPAPEARLRSLDDLAKAIPHFGPFIAALAATGPTTFQAFLAAIDETLWSTAPAEAHLDRSLATLIGRPLAFMRAELQLVLDGPPALDPSWQYTFAPAPNPLAGFDFAVELGALDRLEDGLIGYFVGDDFQTFNIVPAAGATADGFLRPIGADGVYPTLRFDGVTTLTVAMLVDPRAAVHATTAILPVTSVRPPARRVDAALARLEVDVPIRGLLAAARPTRPPPPGFTPPSTIVMPTARRAGTWTWVERLGDRTTVHPIAPPASSPAVAQTDLALRTGVLRLAPATGRPPRRS
ncbi:MAG: IPT/TIG domain-containing protein [Kofleriaceae bacterium]|nr:IPT/TIG domain-containing protein [Kofleriaceae bacterium]MBP9169727.1 IPT/TIG domain-containing protein [Kofleriaceae bacterium]MBP9858143.1 IPT/TIG domain-containing protein [Kofleriaceae bacterium]